jgi:hypothetical protein
MEIAERTSLVLKDREAFLFLSPSLKNKEAT